MENIYKIIFPPGTLSGSLKNFHHQNNIRWWLEFSQSPRNWICWSMNIDPRVELANNRHQSAIADLIHMIKCSVRNGFHLIICVNWRGSCESLISWFTSFDIDTREFLLAEDWLCWRFLELNNFTRFLYQ